MFHFQKMEEGFLPNKTSKTSYSYNFRITKIEKYHATEYRGKIVNKGENFIKTLPSSSLSPRLSLSSLSISRPNLVKPISDLRLALHRWLRNHPFTHLIIVDCRPKLQSPAGFLNLSADCRRRRPLLTSRRIW